MFNETNVVHIICYYEKYRKNENVVFKTVLTKSEKTETNFVYINENYRKNENLIHATVFARTFKKLTRKKLQVTRRNMHQGLFQSLTQTDANLSRFLFSNITLAAFSQTRYCNRVISVDHLAPFIISTRQKSLNCTMRKRDLSQHFATYCNQ